MTAAGTHFDEFEPHTLLKHAILRAYLTRWGRILLKRDRKLLRFVDACAGRGHDAAGNPGSPLIAVEEASSAAGQLTRERGEDVRVQVIAVEKKRTNAEALKHAIEGSPSSRDAEVVRGTLEDVLPKIEQSFRTVPTLFFVDPFGMEPLRADLIRRALAGPQNEVLLLFASQASLRHVGATAAGQRAVSKAPDLFSAAEEPVIIECAPHSKADMHRIEGGRRSAAILDAAFGGDGWQGVLSVDRPQRLDWLLARYEQLLRSFGASHVLTIPIFDSSRSLKYHLLHASKHPRAFGVMKEAAEYAWGKADQTAAEVMRLVASPSVRMIARDVVTHFAGQKGVAWDGDASRDVPTVRRYALEHTDLWPHQTKELREVLKKPYRLPGRKNVYDFPVLKR